MLDSLAARESGFFRRHLSPLFGGAPDELRRSPGRAPAILLSRLQGWIQWILSALFLWLRRSETSFYVASRGGELQSLVTAPLIQCPRGVTPRSSKNLQKADKADKADKLVFMHHLICRA